MIQFLDNGIGNWCVQLDSDFPKELRESLNKLIPIMVRQAHHERNQAVTVRPELVEGLNQRFLR